MTAAVTTFLEDPSQMAGNTWVAQIVKGPDASDATWIGIFETEEQAKGACAKHHARASKAPAVQPLVWVRGGHGREHAGETGRTYRVYQDDR